MLALCALVPADARKKAKAEPLLFPDGTPVPEWFKEAEVPAPETLGKLYNIADYGAISDPNNVQTELIQSVIDKAAEEGGGVVVIPEGIYKSGALFFRQGTHLHLLRGAVLLGSEHIYDFPVVMTRIEGEVCKYFPALINADGLDGFTLTGCGTIDGNGSPYWKAFRIRRQWNPKCTNKDEQRPRLLHVSNSRNVTIADVTLQNSPFWTCHIYKTDHIKLLNLRIFSPREPIKSASADGIDLDVCSNVHVKGCRITVNDDAICFKGAEQQHPRGGVLLRPYHRELRDLRERVHTDAQYPHTQLQGGPRAVPASAQDAAGHPTALRVYHYRRNRGQLPLRAERGTMDAVLRPQRPQGHPALIRGTHHIQESQP